MRDEGRARVGAVVSGGAERVAVGLANHLDSVGDRVAIVCTTDTGNAAYPLNAGIRWYRGMRVEDGVRAKTTYLVRSLREFDPDVILLGEMRDAETVATAMTAAEMSQLLFSTLHTTSAPGSVAFEGVTKEVYRELDDARVFLLSSDYEGVPNAFLGAHGQVC